MILAVTDRENKKISNLFGLENNFSWKIGGCKKIGICQYNFFQIQNIAKKLNLPEISVFSVFPVKNILQRFLKWIDCTREILNEQQFELIFINSDLFSILARMEENHHKLKENDAIRALGVVCNHAFIGPKRLLVDPNVNCNLDCIYCRLHSPLRKKEKEDYLSQNHFHTNSHLPWEILEKAIFDAKENKVDEICIVGGGEPTLYPHFSQLIHLVKKLGMVLNFSTNGLNLNPTLSLQIVENDVNRVTISVSGSNPKSYKIIHPSKKDIDFFDLENKILNLNLYKEAERKKGEKFLKVDLLHVIHAFNYKEMLSMIVQAKKLHADRVWFQLLHVNDFSRFLCLQKNQMEEATFLLSQAKALAKKLDVEVADYMDLQMDHLLSDGTWSKNVFDTYGCLVGWNFSYLDVEGSLSFCCGDKLIAPLDLEKNFSHLWKSDLYSHWREKAKNYNWKQNIKGFKGDLLLNEFCHNCDNHNFNSEITQWIKELDLLPWLQGRYSREKKSEPSDRKKKVLRIENSKQQKGWYFNVSLTDSCQFRCRFCNTWKNPTAKELTLAQWILVLEKTIPLIQDARINFAGGEPMLKWYFHHLIQFLSLLGVETSMATNAGAITKKRAKQLAKSGISIIGISIDGFASTHNYLRGIKNAFEYCMKVISWIREINQTIEINLLTLILKDNLKEIPELVTLAKEDKNITHIHFQALSVLGEYKDNWWKTNPLWPETEKVHHLLDYLIEHQKKEITSGLKPVTICNPNEQLLSMKEYFANPQQTNMNPCTIDQSGYTLDARGDLFYCPFHPPFTNLLQKDQQDEAKKKEAIAKIRSCTRTNCHLRTNCCFEIEEIPKKYGHITS